MVEGDPAAVDTTLLPFMRSNCIYTLDIAVVPYLVLIYAASAWMISPALVSRLTVAGPSERITSGSKQAFPTPTSGWAKVHFITLLFVVWEKLYFTRMFCWKWSIIQHVSSLSLWVDDLLYVINGTFAYASINSRLLVVSIWIVLVILVANIR